ncbi:MAG: hypothetical protein NC311_06505 [Muribaculaceae bacterium]|nr:hypothetical protein [Muribaculaceae bacterium]
MYNAHSMMKDFWTYEDILCMPIKSLLKEVKYFTPKLREIAKQQEAARVKAELEGKQRQKRQQKSRRTKR